MAESTFIKIKNKLSSENKDVEPGKMMSSPGITYKGKVFAFFYKDKMVFRLGRNFDVKKTGVLKFELLNPFKNKPPMKDWFIISEIDEPKWEKLANSALLEIQKKVNK